MPEGTVISMVEEKAVDRGRLARASGCSCIIVGEIRRRQEYLHGHQGLPVEVRFQPHEPQGVPDGGDLLHAQGVVRC